MLTLRFFGPPAVLVDGAPIPRLKTRKGLWLLALLALRAGREVERSWLAGTLWPENDESQSLAYLRQSLADLRAALGTERERVRSTTVRTIRLDPEGADIDVAAFDAAMERGDLPALRLAVALHRGPLLEGCLEEWVLAERTRRLEQRQGALESLARHELSAGDPRSAAARLRDVLAVEPLREGALCLLLRALFDAGDHAAVVQEYRDHRLLLHREVNAEPAAETRALYEDLRRRARSAPAAPVARARGRLPVPLTPLIGREAEIAGGLDAIRTSRLVTLTGIGGVGKTRLALAVASAGAGEFPDGAWFVDLSPIADPRLAARAAAAGLGIEEEAGRTAEQSLVAGLRHREAILVLDNCEHVLLAAASLAERLLEGCPALRILATSRQRLGLVGEVVRPVPPLPVPPEARRGPDVGLSPAVRLFVDRARRVRDGFDADPAAEPAVAEICRRLDGIPFAIELAAARARAMSPPEIARRLADRFGFLSGGSPTAEPRRQTLRAMLDWSYDLLDAPERTLLARLSIFAGGWTMEAAEAVCACRHLPASAVLDVLTALVDRSLVVAEPAGHVTRYRLLDTVRHYARERLARAGQEAAVGMRHREHFLELATAAGGRLVGPEAPRWVERLGADHENLRAALEHDGCPTDHSRRLRALGSLQRYWVLSGLLSEGRAAIEAALQQPAGDDRDRTAALLAGAHLATRQADLAAGRRHYEEALRLARRCGDRLAEARALTGLGQVAFARGEAEEAWTGASRGLAIQRELGDRVGTCLSLMILGHVLLRRGELDDARARFLEALAESSALGDRSIQGGHLNALGMAAEARGAYDEARDYFEESLARHREIGDRVNQLANLNNLASVAWSSGDAGEALSRYREGLSLARELGDNRSARMVAFLLEGIAAPLQARGRSATAAGLLGAADALRVRVGVPRAPRDAPEYETLVAEVRSSMGDAAFGAAYDRGSLLPLNEALDVAAEPGQDERLGTPPGPAAGSG